MPTNLLALPYDIRYLIYKGLFPEDQQLYIQVYDKDLHSISPPGTIPTNVQLVCRQLYLEASGIVYNDYLFNIVGTKTDCLANYRPFLQTLRKHARSEVNINAFSNGDHSATMCLSLQAGDAKMDILNRRRRGEPKTIRELEAEQKREIEPLGGGDWVARGLAIVAILISLISYAFLSKA